MCGEPELLFVEEQIIDLQLNLLVPGAGLEPARTLLPTGF